MRKRYREKTTLLICSFAVLLNFIVQVQADIGLSARFSDIVLENLEIGRSYNFSSMKNLPLTTINNSDQDADVKVDVQIPQKDEMKENFEPIPDISWVKVVPDHFKLMPTARNLSDIIITIPDDPKLVGKQFQVMLWPHTLNTNFLGLGVRLRIRFSVSFPKTGDGGVLSGANSRKLSSLMKNKEMSKARIQHINFRIDPNLVTAENVPLGRTLDFKKDLSLPIKIVNTGEMKIKLNVQKLSYVNPQRVPAGFEELPKMEWITVQPQILNAEADSIVPLKIKIKIPDQPEYRGKKYAVLIGVALMEEEIPVNIYSQILIKTSE